MILPSGDADFEGPGGPEPSYFALRPSNLSSSSSEEFVSTRFLSEPLRLEHARGSNSCTGALYNCWHKPCLITRKRAVIGGCGILFVFLAIIFVGHMYANELSVELIPPDPEVPPPPSFSETKTFARGAVCADGVPCAAIGRTMLDRNGSAVDAAIASLICNGMINMQSMGFGGGFFMTIYDREKRQTLVLNARDAAPSAAKERMFDGLDKSAVSSGALSITVPGELAGYWEAHRRFGKLPWPELFAPSIELCDAGYNLTGVQYGDLSFNRDGIFSDPTLREWFVDPETNDFRRPGSLIVPTKLCETMKIIAEKTPSVLYNGTMGKALVEDIAKKGGILKFEDLNNYRAKWEEPMSTTFSDGTQVHSVNVPGNGPLLTLILNVFDELKFKPNDLANENNTVRTYHRMLETFKFAYAQRSQFGDVNLTRFINTITSHDFAKIIRSRINDNKTMTDPTFYGLQSSENPDDHGTAHISVIAPNGDAVSVTSSINLYFGCGIVSESTGILMNSGMEDFGVPGRINYFGIPPSPNNFIAPGKRPLSSMCPTILVDKNGDVKMSIGAAGGTKIPTAIAFVIARHLWLGDSLKQAIDAPRIHHQLNPMEISYEYGVTRQVIKGLKSLGHATQRYRMRGSVVCALEQMNHTVYGNSDFRKGGEVVGVD